MIVPMNTSSHRTSTELCFFSAREVKGKGMIELPNCIYPIRISVKKENKSVHIIEGSRRSSNAWKFNQRYS